MLHFHEVAHGFVKDSMEHIGGELLLCCVVGCDRVACHFTIIADTGQHGLLSYHLDLGLTVGVACRTVQMVYLVIQMSRLAICWEQRSFVSGEDGSWGLIWQDIGTAGVGIPM